MYRFAQITVALVLSLASIHPANGQFRGRKYAVYDNQNPGGYPKRKLIQFAVRNARKTKKVAIPKKETTKEEIPHDDYYYVGYDFGIGVSPFLLRGSPQLLFNYDDLSNSSAGRYGGSIDGRQFGKYYPNFSFSIEGGKINGRFLSLDLGGSLHSNRDIFYASLTFGRNYLLGNNKLKISPAIGIGFILSTITLPQKIDISSSGVNILGTTFPYKNNGDNEIEMKLDERSGLVRFQLGISPRIKNHFPLQLQIAYHLCYAPNLSVRAFGPNNKGEFSVNAGGMTFNNNGYDLKNTWNYQGFAITLNLFILSQKD